jgi:ferritin-like metal-binding protein YciE
MGEEQKIVQYLNEAHAMEQGLTRVLQSQIAMTPRGRYREALEGHLIETREHSRRLQRRLRELRAGGNPLAFGIGLVQSAIGQALALSKAPLDLLRGSGGEEKVLKNAKDTVATEALEIATYTAICNLAHATQDRATEALAESILADERRMLERVLAEIPRLTAAMVGAELDGEAGGEPWPGYDEQNVEEIRAALDGLDEAAATRVREYERAHKDRAGVREASERVRVAPG